MHMASIAVAGVGTVFVRWNGAAWEAIAEINSITGPSMGRETIDVTSLDTEGEYRQFITGFKNGGTIVLAMNFTRDTYELMKDDFEVDDPHDYGMVLPDEDETVLQFGALVTELPMTIPADDKVTADVTLQITGEVKVLVGELFDGEGVTALTAVVTNESQIDLYWNGNSDNYRIYSSTNGNDWIEVGTSDIPSYSATGLTLGRLYYFRVVSYSGSEESISSDVIQVHCLPYIRAIYDFDETTGTIVNDSYGILGGETNAVINQFGKVNKCYLYDTNNQWTRVANGRALIPNKNSWSVSCWIYVNSIGDTNLANRVWLFARSAGDHVNILLATGLDDKLQFYYYNGSGVTTDVLTVDLNAWYHVVVTHDGADFKVYVNGNLESTINNNLQYDIYPNIVYFGNEGGVHQRPFKGLIDQLIVYDKDISLNYVNYIHNQGNGREINKNYPKNRVQNIISSWWSLPKALYYDDKTYLSGIDDIGNILVCSYNHSDDTIERIILKKLGIDDHNTPAILFAPNKPVIIFYAGHNETNYIYYRKSLTNNSINDLQSEQFIDFGEEISYVQSYCWGNNIYVFSRSSSYPWCVVCSDDYGETWGNVIELFNLGKITYMATVQKENILHCCFYGHPTSSTVHDIYHCLIDLSNGDVKKIDGTLIDNIFTPTTLPITVNRLQLAYDHTDNNIRMFDINSNNDILIMTWTDDDDSLYQILKFNGSTWDLKPLVPAGGVFGYTPSIHYNAGVSFPNPYDKDIIYVGREESGVWYIDELTSEDGWDTFKSNNLYKSNNKLFRPYGILNAGERKVLFNEAFVYGDYDVYHSDVVLR